MFPGNYEHIVATIDESFGLSAVLVH